MTLKLIYLLIIDRLEEIEDMIIIYNFRFSSRPEVPFTSQTYPSHSSCFNWIGQTMTQLKIDPNQQKPVRLSAGFSKPGIYNLNRLAVFVTYTSDSSQMVLQKHNSPSVIVVNDVS